jgi:hypothetical protein
VNEWFHRINVAFICRFLYMLGAFFEENQRGNWVEFGGENGRQDERTMERPPSAGLRWMNEAIGRESERTRERSAFVKTSADERSEGGGRSADV